MAEREMCRVHTGINVYFVRLYKRRGKPASDHENATAKPAVAVAKKARSSSPAPIPPPDATRGVDRGNRISIPTVLLGASLVLLRRDGLGGTRGRGLRLGFGIGRGIAGARRVSRDGESGVGVRRVLIGSGGGGGGVAAGAAVGGGTATRRRGDEERPARRREEDERVVRRGKEDEDRDRDRPSRRREDEDRDTERRRRERDVRPSDIDRYIPGGGRVTDDAAAGAEKPRTLRRERSRSRSRDRERYREKEKGTETRRQGKELDGAKEEKVMPEPEKEEEKVGEKTGEETKREKSAEAEEEITAKEVVVPGAEHEQDNPGERKPETETKGVRESSGDDIH
ncbi:hypothetical protein LTR02_005038 [Friedmanniomyces endolithicus]|nr:hypothetical protein LTR02_005038 [Friedmanniomyces endolithicus]